MPPRRPRHSTIPAAKPAKHAHGALPPSTPRPALRSPRSPARADIGRIIDASESSLVDVIDNLLNRGVVLNADLILALADVDLVYVRLSALLCAADRVLPPLAR
jgi:hypothetical protein